MHDSKRATGMHKRIDERGSSFFCVSCLQFAGPFKQIASAFVGITSTRQRWGINLNEQQLRVNTN